MPGILPFYNVNDRTLNDLTADEFQARQKLIDHHWRYYNGMHHKPLKVKANEYDDNIIINLCGRSVDKMTEFIGSPQRLDLPGDEESEQESPAQQALTLAYEAQMADVPQVMVAGMVTGHNWLKINQEDDGATWRLDLLDGRHIIAFWDVTNMRRVVFYRMEWVMGDEKRRIDMLPDWLLETVEETVDNGDGTTTRQQRDTPLPVVPRVAEQWTIIEYRMKGSNSRWEELTRDDWAFPFAPVIDWPNKRVPHQYYGASNFKNAIQINDAVNFIASNTGRIIKFHAHPRTIGKGMEPDAIQATSIDGLFTIPDASADIFNLEMQSDLGSSMNFLNQLKAEFFAEQRMVDLSTVRDKLGQITNFGVRMVFNEQLENTDEKRRLYGQWLARAYQRLLGVMGTDIEEPEAQWDDPLPVNRLEAVQTAQMEVDLGVSKQSVFEDIERDYFKEQEKIADEGTANNDGLVTALTEFGNVGGGQRSLFPVNGNGLAQRAVA